MVGPLVGVLALQGDYARHAAMLKTAGTEVRRVVIPADLESCSGLVIPGGESTTLMHLARAGGMIQPLRDFAVRGAIMGTCAGLIILAQRLEKSSLQTLSLLDIQVQRNGFGRQVQSFIDPVELELDGTRTRMEGVFIRAPRIREVGPGVSVLGRWRGEPVMVRSGHILGLTFHPELTADASVHRYFIRRVMTGPQSNAGAA